MFGLRGAGQRDALSQGFGTQDDPDRQAGRSHRAGKQHGGQGREEHGQAHGIGSLARGTGSGRGATGTSFLGGRVV